MIRSLYLSIYIKSEWEKVNENWWSSLPTSPPFSSALSLSNSLRPWNITALSCLFLWKREGVEKGYLFKIATCRGVVEVTSGAAAGEGIGGVCLFGLCWPEKAFSWQRMVLSRLISHLPRLPLAEVQLLHLRARVCRFIWIIKRISSKLEVNLSSLPLWPSSPLPLWFSSRLLWKPSSLCNNLSQWNPFDWKQ